MTTPRTPEQALPGAAAPGPATAGGPPPTAPAPARLARRRRPLVPRGSRTAVVVVIAMVLAALLAPLLYPHVTAVDAANRLLAPSPAHPFGTDELGRDLLGRVLHAGRLTLLISTGAMVLSVVLGAAWGMLAASAGGWLDEVLMRTADAVLAIPMVLFGLVCVAALGTTPGTLVLVLGVLKAPLTARVVRSSTMVELTADYVRGLTVVGASRRRILFAEVLPNVVPTVVAQATLNIATALMLEATLSFMGLGVQPPEASWGTLLKSGYAVLHQAWWYAVFPAVAIVALVASLNVIGQQLQRTLDTRTV